MEENNNSIGQAEARAMIEVFASVGATRFDVTLTTCAGGKDGFKRGVGLGGLRRILPTMLEDTERKRLNLIVRPYGFGVTFIQLDDLKPLQLVPIAPAVFLSLETSPGNFQAWLAMHGQQDEEFIRRVKRGTGADRTASGATRIAGSLNFKDKYAPDFPRVAIHAAEPGRTVTADRLHELGLVAEPEPVAAQPLRTTPALSRSKHAAWPNKWPDYAECLRNGQPSQSRPGQTRESIADFTWCLIAADHFGWPVDDIARQLMEESAKARENGPAYALKTATNAAKAAQKNAARRQQPPKQHRIG